METQVLIHGTLVVSIHDAENIVTQERMTGTAPAILRKIIEKSEEVLRLGKGYSQYYATVDLGSTRVGRTRVLEGQPKDPVWNETFHIYCAHRVSEVTVSIKDAAIVGTTVVGRAKVPAIELLTGRKVEGSYCLYNDHVGELKRARIRFCLQFWDAKGEVHYGKGILDWRNPGVPYCYFPQRKGCRVTLYQDAHMGENFLPPIYQAHNRLYQPGRCWEDMFDAIWDAKHLIYITGWSLVTGITLCRDPRRRGGDVAGSLTLGEVLKRKADEGVRVNLLVWDDRTSNWFNENGKMATKDEATAKFFQNTKVNCFLCPRDASRGVTMLQAGKMGLGFSHHQKTLSVDAAAGFPLWSPKRRIVSFVGGLDFSDGRYDTQHHSLFRTLNTEHRHDFHQFLPGASLECGGPREPWHDVHSKLEGPVAWDVLYNFEQRWRKQAGPSREHLLIPILDLNLGPETITQEHDPETWNVQLFRSIDAGAAYGFPESPERAAEQGLVSGKDNTIDRSIQHAYIDAIRRARRFIYIENQYFMGSSFGWESKQDVGVYNLIPMELVRKVVSKIEAGERFSVYVVIPLYPEGDPPDSAPTQAILGWQRRTVQMMYREIAAALRVNRIYDQHPKDYLSFFCLGNRETRLADEHVATKAIADAYYKAAQNKRRFMVYVHSKMMLVDDEYIIVGSANINERSMNGARDSEIAMGAYQPRHINEAHKSRAAGEVHGFRMALWYEHIGFLDTLFLEPWSLECMRRVNLRAEELWRMFEQEEVVDMPGHLMAYPYHVDLEGSVSAVKGCEVFPDSTAKVLGGAPSSLIAYAIPDILTT